MTWTAATSQGGDLLNNIVAYRKNLPGEAWKYEQPTSLATSWAVYPLDNGVEHEFRVAARNSYGYGPWSAVVTGTPKAVPSVPFSISATSAGTTSIKATWGKPAQGLDPTGYRVEATVSDWEEVVSATTRETGDTVSLTLTGLERGTPYMLRVQATNAEGGGPWRYGASATTEGTRVPGKLILFAIECMDGVLPLQPDPPTDSDAQSITKIEFQYKVHSQSWGEATSKFVEYPPEDSSPVFYDIMNAENGVFYTARVRAVSDAGNGEWSDSVTASPSGRPTAPQQINVVPGDGDISATWSYPAEDGGHDIIQYKIIWWSLDSNDEAVKDPTEVVLDANTLTWTKSDLTNGERYGITVDPRNTCGKGLASQKASLWVVAGSPVAPDAPSLTAGTQQIEASWTAPENNNGSPITHYDLQHRISGSSTWTEVSVPKGTSHTITSLESGDHEVRVRAANARGDGPWSASSTATVMGTPARPAAPALVGGDEQIEASWKAPYDGDSPITGYILRYRVSDKGTWTEQTVGTSTSYTIGSLINGTEYDVQVSASNDDGSSDWSPTSTAMAQIEAPGTPDALELAPGNGVITVSWDPPTSGGPMDHYDLQYREKDDTTWIAIDGISGTSYRIGGLTNGTGYEVRVRADNPPVHSDYSDIKTATPIAAPRAPAAPTLEAGDAQITASWNAPTSGGPVHSYELQYRTGEGSWNEVENLSGMSHVITSLTNGATYEVRVRASNTSGDSAWSDSATATPQEPLQVPNKPAAPTLIAGDGRITASWNAPTSGGAPSHYDLQYRQQNVGNWTEVEILSGMSHEIMSLTNGTTYEVQVRSANDAGDSDWSASATATPQPALLPPRTPDAPSLVAGNRQITASWSAPSRGGAPDHYDLRYGVSGSGTWTEVEVISTSLVPRL